MKRKVLITFLVMLLLSSIACQFLLGAPPNAVETPIQPQLLIPTATAIPVAPRTVQVKADGSGDYSSLEVAVADLPAGSTIYLSSGDFYLSSRLEIHKTLHIIGVDHDDTSVYSSEGNGVIVFFGPGELTLKNFGMYYQGIEWGNVLTVTDSAVNIDHCVFSGGIYDEGLYQGGAGIVLLGKSNGIFQHAVSVKNQMHGIAVQEQAQATIINSSFQKNIEDGIFFADNSSGSVRESSILLSGLHGISLTGDSNVLLENNTVYKSGQVGIRLSDNAISEISNNTSTENGLHGFSIRDNAEAVLRNNSSEDNDEFGFRLSGAASARFYNNTARNNALSGFLIRENATAILDENNLGELNGESGFVFFGNSISEVSGNNAVENGLHGFSVRESASVNFKENTSQYNIQVGFRLSGTSFTTLEGNSANSNGLSGIIVRENAETTLQNNFLSGNREAGIRFSEQARGLVKGNECTNNMWGIYIKATANPILEDNNCYSNVSKNIRDER